MMYGIVYVYRLSDFMALARAHGLMHIYQTSCWVKEKVAPVAGCDLQWTDVHELGFMGAFGIGHKMQIDGESHIGKTGDNHALWTRSRSVANHVHKVWLKEIPTALHRLILVPGMLMRTEVVNDARVPWNKFFADKIPETVPVYSNEVETSERR